MKQEFGNASTRRDFLVFATAAAAATIVPRAMFAQSVAESTLAADPLRPQFHLLPARNWMNDPNGPIYFNGAYHMFFQYNPQAAVWGDMSWNHATSPDMIHWSHLPLALTPTPDGPDSFGVFSGSALRVGQRVYQVYTGTRIAPSKDLATIRDGESRIQESQCLAYSDDPNLVHWTKLPQPVIPLPPPGMAITGFRDPSAWKQGDTYYMTVASGIAKTGGCVLLYRSNDLHNWEYLHILTSGTWNGNHTANPCDDGEMWECPDFFPLDSAHVLIYSTLGKVFWQSGKLDPATMTFHASKTGELDLGAFYAPKTQLDAHGRRILWGWIPERRPEAAMRQAGWSGMMSLPREMRLDEDGTLRLKALPELSALRDTPLHGQHTSRGFTQTLQNASGEVLYTGPEGSPFAMTMAMGSTELLHLTYLPDKHAFLADGKEIPLGSGDAPSLHAFVDGSVIELIVGERIGYTRRFYYEQKTAPDIEVTLNAQPRTRGDLRAWKIRPISNNRLTTSASAI